MPSKFYLGGEFPLVAVCELILLNIDEYPKMLRLSKGWNQIIKECMDLYISKSNLEEYFTQKYGNLLSLQKSYISATPLQFCGKKGLRLDRVLECKVNEIPSRELGKTLRIGFDYEYTPSKKDAQVYT